MPLATSQIRQASEKLARAFQDGPLWQYVFPSAVKRARGLSCLTTPVVRYAQYHGQVHTTRSVSGLAAWLGPGNTTMTIGRMIRAGMAAVPWKISLTALRRLVIFQNYVDELHEHSVSGQHWYLVALGVEPACQGKGIGSRLIQPVLIQADADGLPCYLETLNAKNIRFYQKHGFGVVSESIMPSSGLRIWGLVRADRNAPLSETR